MAPRLHCASWDSCFPECPPVKFELGGGSRHGLGNPAGRHRSAAIVTRPANSSRAPPVGPSGPRVLAANALGSLCKTTRSIGDRYAALVPIAALALSPSLMVRMKLSRSRANQSRAEDFPALRSSMARAIASRAKLARAACSGALMLRCASRPSL